MLFKRYFLILIYIFSTSLYGQKNIETHTLYIKFDQFLNLEELEDVFQMDGFNKLSIKYPFTVKKGITLSKKKMDKLSVGNKSIKNIFKIETQLSLNETEHLVLKLNNLKNVQYCYRKQKRPMDPPPQDIAPTTPNFEMSQSYLESDPGVNMRYAWGQGANGTGINIRVVEYGININHEDLNDGKVSIAAGMTINSEAIDNGYAEHGTFTAGVIIADKGAYGVSGLAYNANDYILFPEWTEENGYDRVLAVTNAIANSNAGDIIIYEMQIAGQFGNPVPAEFEPVIWDLTKAATESGITIVAAAGNGNQNLDDEYYTDYLNRGDSGAIIVGAGNPDLSHSKGGFSCYGSRVNLQGWGSDVFTTGIRTSGEFFIIGGDDNQSYWSNYAGTSSATAVVGGCVTVLQSYYYGLTGSYLTGVELRDILVNTGIPQGSGGHIGPLPNMESAMEAINQVLDLDNYNLGKFYVSPNPASDYINITFKDNLSSDDAEVIIYNLLGQKVLQEALESNKTVVNIQEIKSGVYILKIENGGQQTTKKIIIN